MNDPNTSTAYKKAELLLDHHKDTFQHILYYTRARNRLFLAALTLLALLVVDLYSSVEPGGVKLATLVNIYINTALETPKDSPVNFDLAVINSAAWFVLLVLVIPYYKYSIHIDRQYRYLETVEDRIGDIVGDTTFITREGKAYKSVRGVPNPGAKGRPIFLQAVGPLYVYVFPLLLTSIVVWKLVAEYDGTSNGIYAVNAGIGGLLSLYNVLYVCWVMARK